MLCYVSYIKWEPHRWWYNNPPCNGVDISQVTHTKALNCYQRVISTIFPAYDYYTKPCSSNIKDLGSVCLPLVSVSRILYILEFHILHFCISNKKKKTIREDYKDTLGTCKVLKYSHRTPRAPTKDVCQSGTCRGVTSPIFAHSSVCKGEEAAQGALGHNLRGDKGFER